MLVVPGDSLPRLYDPSLQRSMSTVVVIPSLRLPPLPRSRYELLTMGLRVFHGAAGLGPHIPLIRPFSALKCALRAPSDSPRHRAVSPAVTAPHVTSYCRARFPWSASPRATRLYAPGGLGLATVCVR